MKCLDVRSEQVVAWHSDLVGTSRLAYELLGAVDDLLNIRKSS